MIPPIVIVDDTREDAILAQRVLEQCGVKNPILLLNSGEQCIAYFEGKAPFQSRVLPCIVFLDMIMGAVSGLDVLRTFRTMEAAQSSVLIMLSGLADWSTVNRGYQLGATTFLVKPLTIYEVMQMLSSIRALTVVTVPAGHVLTIAKQGVKTEAPAGASMEISE